MASDSRPPASQPITAPPSSSIPQTPQNPETTAAATATAAAAHHHHHTGDETCACGRPLPLWTHSPPPPNNTYRPLRAPAISAPSNSQSIILSPVPHAEHVPLLPPPYRFVTPVKQIRSPEDIAKFHASPSGRNFIGFVVALSDSVRGQKISHPCLVSPVVQSILDSLDYLGNCVDEIPPLPQNSRYGNLAYREWHARMSQSKHLIDGVLGEGLVSAAEEVFPYFTDSFGNTTRIDYGTGHETNFAAWLYCLARLGVLKEEDYPAVVRRVFVKYLDLMRKLQTTYWLEPAGSHGVWGLDDYHFLPFIFGASQLVDHKYMKPKSIHNDDILENYSGEYMYLACVKFVKKVKKGHMAEHSPMLDDISGVPNWGKVHSGMLKMYKAEVLEKVPIMQHFLFGSIIKW